MINYLFKDQNWQAQMNDIIHRPSDLLAYLQLPQSLLNNTLAAAEQFKLKVPRQFAAKMRHADPDDPLLLQVLPLHIELEPDVEFVNDPLAEQQANTLHGMLHKYKSRILITLTGACAIHCRYCFRRHFPYADNTPSMQHMQAIVAYIEQHPAINEVIFSGGDPLSLSNEKISRWISLFEALAQIKTLRFHSRLAIVIPQRLEQELLTRLKSSRLHIVLVVHCNHPQEIDQSTRFYLQQCKQHNIHLLNQSVLLKNINDQVTTLAQLSFALFEAGVMPYYLHLLDKVAGAKHFAITDQQAIAIHQQLQVELPGYLVPKLAREIAGVPHKTILA